MADTLINGYELMPDFCRAESWQNEISFTKLRTDLGEGMGASVLFGANTGVQKFRLSMKLRDFTGSATLTYNGQTFTPAEYLWDLYCRSEVTGTPFVIQNLRNSQYYLVEFANPSLTYERMLHKFYTTGIELRQARRSGVTVFDVSKLSGVWGWYRADTLALSNGQTLVGWGNSQTGGAYPLMTSNAVYTTPAQNGLGAVRLNGTSAYLTASSTPDIVQAFVVMKQRETTFSNYAGIVTNRTTLGGFDAALVGSSGTTKFENLAFTAGTYAYRKNGIAYAQTDQQAPMNTFGIVHARHKTGFTNIVHLQVGKDRDIAGRFAAADIAEMIFCDRHLSDTDARELTEHLTVKWGL